MPPRIRSLLPRLPFARAQKASPSETPKVFRDFVETLQKLDAVRTPPPKRASTRTRKRGYAGNGVRKPSSRRDRP